MDQRHSQDSKRPQPTGTEYGINEALLRSEIGFWRELIESCDDSQPPESIERMHQALALAESRLACLFETYQQSGRAGLKPTSNVYHLEERRRKRAPGGQGA